MLQCLLVLCYVIYQQNLSFADSKHISCQMMDIQGGVQLSSLQGVLSTIISGPFQASEAKDKCIDLAKVLHYPYIGVMGGYCVSVKNFTDYNSVPVYDQCKDGNGEYDPSSTTQYMDVYRIITSSGNPQHGGIKSAPHSTSGALPNTGVTFSYIISLFIVLSSLTLMLKNPHYYD